MADLILTDYKETPFYDVKITMQSVLFNTY